MEAVNLVEKFSRFQDYWHPKIVGELDDYHVKLVKVKGEFVWHRHEAEDEMFLVVRGRLQIRLRDGEITLNPGELTIIPTAWSICPSPQKRRTSCCWSAKPP